MRRQVHFSATIQRGIDRCEDTVNGYVSCAVAIEDRTLRQGQIAERDINTDQ